MDKFKTQFNGVKGRVVDKSDNGEISIMIKSTTRTKIVHHLSTNTRKYKLNLPCVWLSSQHGWWWASMAKGVKMRPWVTN